MLFLLPQRTDVRQKSASSEGRPLCLCAAIVQTVISKVGLLGNNGAFVARLMLSENTRYGGGVDGHEAEYSLEDKVFGNSNACGYEWGTYSVWPAEMSLV